MNNHILEMGLTFDDVLIEPAYSDVLPEEVDLSSKLSKNIRLTLPILSAAMDTVSGAEMASLMNSLGGAGVIHRNQSIAAQAEMVKAAAENSGPSKNIGAAVGFFGEAADRAKVLAEAGANFIVVDTAHGDTKAMLEMVGKLKADRAFSGVDIIAGNIATSSAAKRLIDAGADALKVGIGPGSICTTRVVSGVGVPQISAIQNVSEVARKSKVPLIADGGIKYIGDIAKAFAAGATCVMLGSMLAGTKEALGEVIEIQGVKYKAYRGMGSAEVLASKEGFSKDRYFHTGKQSKRAAAEGVSGFTKYTGEASQVLAEIEGGLRQAMFYTGAASIPELYEKATLIQMTAAGFKESHPHDIVLI